MSTPIPIFKPRTEGDLRAWSANFLQKVSGTPLAFGLSVPQIAHYQTLHDEFAARFAAASNPTTNSKATVAAKNLAKQRLLDSDGGAWDLVNIVQAFPGTTDAMRGTLGLRLLDVSPVRTARPDRAPQLAIMFTSGRVLKLRLRDQEHSTRRGKPDGVIGATVLYCVGDHTPEEFSQWMFAMNTSKALFDLVLPASVPAGSKVWLTAFWFNARMQTSPAATLKCTRVGEGLALAA